MNEAEKNFLTFLAEAIVAAKDIDQFNLVQNEIEQVATKTSPTFDKVYIVFDHAANEILVPGTLVGPKKIARVEEVAKALQKGAAVEKSVAEALQWAALNWNQKHGYARSNRHSD